MPVYLSPSVLVADECAVWPYDRESATVLFILVSARNERSSITLASTKVLGEWGQLLDDTVVASAILDRPLCQRHVESIRG